MKIKPYIILITSIVSCFLLIYTTEAQELITGIKAGYNSSKFTGPGIIDTDNNRMPGINIGGIINKSFPKFDLQSELLISTKGYQINSIADTYISNLLIYIDLPLLIKKNMYVKNNFGAYLTGGLSLMYNILSINLVSELEGIRKFDTGLLFGIGAQYSKVSIELRINQSIINFDKVDPLKYNQVISAGLDFYFKEQKK